MIMRLQLTSKLKQTQKPTSTCLFIYLHTLVRTKNGMFSMIPSKTFKALISITTNSKTK